MLSPIWITPAGSLGIIPDEEFYQFILNVYDSAQTPQPVSGVLSFDTNRINPATGRKDPRIVIGAGTAFTHELQVGDRLIGDNDVVLGIVGNIVSDTELLLFQDATFTASGVIVRSADNITFTLVSGKLPTGLHIDQFGNMSGVPINGEIEGVPASVQAVTTSTFTIRATNRAGYISDRTFSLTVAGVNPITLSVKNITLGTCFNGDLFSYQLNAYNFNPLSKLTWSVDSAFLPPGVALSPTGLLRGYVSSSATTAGQLSTNYNFKISVSDGFTIDTSNYAIVVYNRAMFTADNTYLRTDSTDVDISITEKYTPVLYNFNTTIDTATQGNYYAYRFIGDDFNGDEISYTLSPNSTDQLPSGLTLNSNTGWLTGGVPFGSLLVTDYKITIRVSKVGEGLSDYYVEREFTLPVVSQISNSTVWNVPNNLGSINNGSISTFAISAYTPSGRPLQYRITSGRLPYGLSLTVDGLIIGRTGFENSRFIDTDPFTGNIIGVTRFKDFTTFDQVYTFTVEVYSSDMMITDLKEFHIRVEMPNYQPYENLYIRALPTREQRYIYNQIINNTDTFPPADIYRAGDPWFGKNTSLRSLFLTGLTPVTPSAYIDTMTKNHYRKILTYGDIKTARALDENFKVKYEVVYVDLIDAETNALGQSAPMDIKLPKNSAGITDVYVNSFDNMRNRITESPAIGYINRSILPEWMTSQQADGRVLGFTRALVLAYTLPGRSAEVAYRVSQDLDRLRLVGFTVDRYEWDNFLSDGFDKETGRYIPGSHTEFTDSIDTGMEYLKFPDVVISTNLTS